MAKILISYRRADTQAMAGRLFDRLSARYGEPAVFMDIDAIPFGIDFRQHIADALRECDVLVALVGPNWLGRRDGGSRIDDAADPVRVELDGAFERGIPIVPVLIDDARMPSEAELPSSLKRFAFLNAAPVDSGRDFRPHVDRLMRSLDGILAAKGVAVSGASVAVAAAPSRSRTTMYAAIGLAVLVVGAGALWATLRMFEGSGDPQRGVAASTPSVQGGAPQGAPPPSTQQKLVVLKSSDRFFVNKYGDDIKSADVNLAVEFDGTARNGTNEEWDAMVKGELDLASFYLSSSADRVPAFAVSHLPGLVRNREHADRVNASAFLAQIKRLSADAGVLVLADAWQSVAVFSRKGCIRKPGDVKGLKIVIYGTGNGAEPMLRTAGAAAVEPMEGDLANVFKSGADALVSSMVAARSMAEPARCVTVPGEYTLGFDYVPLLGSKKTFGRLSASQQSVLLRATKAMQQAQADGLKQLDDYLSGMLTTSGVQTVALSEADYAAWLKVAQASAYQEFAATVPGGKELLDEALAVK
jgi:TRAP-type C4-dicarboxylate transport system substrate-binding protein